MTKGERQPSGMECLRGHRMPRPSQVWNRVLRDILNQVRGARGALIFFEKRIAFTVRAGRSGVERYFSAPHPQAKQTQAGRFPAGARAANAAELNEAPMKTRIATFSPRLPRSPFALRRYASLFWPRFHSWNRPKQSFRGSGPPYRITVEVACEGEKSGGRDDPLKTRKAGVVGTTRTNRGSPCQRGKKPSS